MVLALLFCTVAGAQAPSGDGGASVEGEAPATEADTDTDTEAARSRDVQARSLFLLGETAFSNGLYAEALDHFERAYELSPRPQLLYNIGASADRLRQNEKALLSFVEYLEALPQAPNRNAVEARLRVLREEIEREDALEAELARAEADTGPPPRRGWIGGVVAAVVVATATAIALGFVLSRDDGPPLVRGTEPVVQTLWRTH